MKARPVLCLFAFCALLLTRANVQAWGLDVDVVGWVTHQVVIPPGCSTIANSLDHTGYGVTQPGHQVSTLLPNMPQGTVLYKYDTRAGKFSENRFGRRGWRNPEETLAPGEGAMIYNPTRRAIVVEFSGWNFPQGQVSLRRGFTLVGNVTSGSGSFLFPGMLGSGIWFDIRDGDVIYTFNQAQHRFEAHRYRAVTGWDSYFYIRPDDSFWIATAYPRTIYF